MSVRKAKNLGVVFTEQQEKELLKNFVQRAKDIGVVLTAEQEKGLQPQEVNHLKNLEGLVVGDKVKYLTDKASKGGVFKEGVIIALKNGKVTIDTATDTFVLSASTAGERKVQKWDGKSELNSQ